MCRAIPINSLLIQAVRQTGELKMPKDSRLEDQEIADLIAWVKMGAPWDPQDHAKPVIPALSAAAAASSVGEDFFETKIRPIFANICSQCHGDTATSGLRVFSRETLLQGGHRGPAIVPNDPEKSLLIQAVRQTGDLKMPKGGRLPAEDVQNLAEWVRMGAPWPQSKPVIASGTPFKIYAGAASVLVVPTDQGAGDTAGEKCALGENGYRPICIGKNGGTGNLAID